MAEPLHPTPVSLQLLRMVTLRRCARCSCTPAHAHGTQHAYTHAAADERPQQWVHMDEEELEEVCAGVRDAALKHTLQVTMGGVVIQCGLS